MAGSGSRRGGWRQRGGGCVRGGGGGDPALPWAQGGSGGPRVTLNPGSAANHLVPPENNVCFCKPMNSRGSRWDELVHMCYPLWFSSFLVFILPCGLSAASAAMASGANQKITVGVACAAMVCASVTFCVWVMQADDLATGIASHCMSLAVGASQ